MIPKRKSPRISGYDYATPNYYFVTICTYQMKCIFGRPGCLNLYGNIAEENLLKIQQINPNFRIDKYVIMPNHVHAIVDVQKPDPAQCRKDLSLVIGLYKMSVTKAIRKFESDKIVWQRSFHDHVIRNQRGYEEIWTYIENNPLKWELDCFYTENI